MKIIVLGAGKVGKTLIKHMSNEDHDIIVVDQNATKVEEVVNQYDVIGVVGNGGSYDILMKAGAEDANLIICVTTSDELNILAGLMAKKMGTRHTIARVRNPDDSSQRDFMRNQLGFSMIVNPELEAASEICRVLSFPSAVKVDTFSRGKVDSTLFIKKVGKHILIVQVYVDDIIFGSTNDSVCERFAYIMQCKFDTCQHPISSGLIK